jgi:hypothetical protein
MEMRRGLRTDRTEHESQPGAFSEAPYGSAEGRKPHVRFPMSTSARLGERQHRQVRRDAGIKQLRRGFPYPFMPGWKRDAMFEELGDAPPVEREAKSSRG